MMLSDVLDTIAIPMLFLFCAAIVIGLAVLGKDEFDE